MSLAIKVTVCDVRTCQICDYYCCYWKRLQSLPVKTKEMFEMFRISDDYATSKRRNELTSRSGKGGKV